jgi:hypothetical protein
MCSCAESIPIGHLRSCFEGLEPRQAPAPPKRTPRPKRVPSVYFLLVRTLGPLGIVKIGQSTRWEQRTAAMLNKMPYLETEVVLVEPGDFGREAELHEKFAADRLQGEWFTWSKAIQDYVALSNGINARQG